MKQKKSKMSARKYDTAKTMDVSKPGKTTPDTSARPVIVTNRSMVQDPTLTDQSKDNSSKPTEATVARGAKTISPVSKSSEEESMASDTAKSAKPDTQKEQAKETATVEAVADQATEDKKKQNKDSDADIARKKELEKLIADKKFFVPIGQVSRRRNRRALIVFLVVIIILIGGYLAIDSKLIKSSVTLPFDFIKT